MWVMPSQVADTISIMLSAVGHVGHVLASGHVLLCLLPGCAGAGASVRDACGLFAPDFEVVGHGGSVDTLFFIAAIFHTISPYATAFHYMKYIYLLLLR